MSLDSQEIESRIEDALDWLSRQPKRYLPRAATLFKVPYARLYARKNGRPSRYGRDGPNKRLSKQEEGTLCAFIYRLDRMYLPPTLEIITAYANWILRQRYADINFVPTPLGIHWTRRFLKRQPKISKLRQRTIELDRFKSHTPAELLSWFRRFNEVVKEEGIHPCDIWNYDESGFRIGVGSDQWIVTFDPKRPVYIPSTQDRQLVTCGECINAAGDYIDPFIICPGVMILESWFEGLDDGILLGVSESGYSNEDLHFEWIQHFERRTRPKRVGRKRLLLIDGFGAHQSQKTIEFCDEHDIIVFSLIPHTTHLCQPLDVVVFQPYKHFHKKAVNAATRTGCTKFNKNEFLAAIGSIRAETLKDTTILSAWRVAGLVPYNPERVLKQLREYEPFQSERDPFATPSSSPRLSSHVNTPWSLEGLKKHTNALEKELDEYDVPTPVKDRTRKVIKSGVGQLSSGLLFEEHFKQTEAAEKARKTREKRGRRVVQKGGVIYSKKAKEKIRERDEKEFETMTRKMYKNNPSLREAEERQRTGNFFS
jgi:hypothetical protein